MTTKAEKTNADGAEENSTNSLLKRKNAKEYINKILMGIFVSVRNKGLACSVGGLPLSVGKEGRSGSAGKKSRACVGEMKGGETGQDVLKTNK